LQLTAGWELKFLRVYDSFTFLRDPCGFFVFPVVKMQTTKFSKVAQSTPLSYPP